MVARSMVTLTRQIWKCGQLQLHLYLPEPRHREDEGLKLQATSDHEPRPSRERAIRQVTWAFGVTPPNTTRQRRTVRAGLGLRRNLHVSPG